VYGCNHDAKPRPICHHLPTAQESTATLKPTEIIIGGEALTRSFIMTFDELEASVTPAWKQYQDWHNEKTDLKPSTKHGFHWNDMRAINFHIVDIREL